ncbi:hypothetical protein COV61_02385 [Candidatus Micrarchaeota archaeon CG11_big_fil_rev_8_21_14_0_20_47_5]|nr:MAG: hypothetical protein AUJ17_00735 [Candidatus Micrarchaeota archaeon CG1_02_47_40]PIN83699.1 MAG: hypothetical protein COV61_02385 [Candidatus Micrarchaeota archaeon CG11_big_fil_rev_8_21_14_0_20_47_5]
MKAKKFCIEDAFRVEKNNELLLISIQPRFSELILNGEKTVELRKRLPKKLPKFAIVYESAPKKQATFLIKIKKFDAAPAKVIWERYRNKCAISKTYFNEYYRGSKQSVALIIEKVLPLEKSISRKILQSYGLTPPQDYRYAPKEIVMDIARR